MWEKGPRANCVTGAMPPQGARRPDQADVRPLDRAGWRRNSIVMPRRTRTSGSAVILLHRLNRAEYANAIRDLLRARVSVARCLPPDDSAYGFG